MGRMDPQASPDHRVLTALQETEARQVFRDQTDRLEFEELRDRREREENLGSRVRWDLSGLLVCKDHRDLSVNVEREESRELSDHRDLPDWGAEWETKDLRVIRALREYLDLLDLRAPLVSQDHLDQQETGGREG